MYICINEYRWRSACNNRHPDDVRLYGSDLEPATGSVRSNNRSKSRGNAGHAGKFQKDRLGVRQYGECPVTIIGNRRNNRLMDYGVC